jgi:RimJ/RimL family protein N-acetyltransferase
MVEIETARLRLRRFTASDLDDLILIFGDLEVMRHLGMGAGTNVSLILKGMMEFWADHGYGRWAVINKEDGRLIGLCGLRLLDGTPELLYVIARAYWGCGLATEAARASLRYAFEELEFERVVALTKHANVASVNVMRKIGMSHQKETSRHGVDRVCYVAKRSEFQADDSKYNLSIT